MQMPVWIKGLFRRSGDNSRPAPLDNNTWLRYRSENNTVIVLVHGLLSSADACWRTKSGTYWPDLIAADEVFTSSNIFLSGYHTSIRSGKYDIAQCALELLTSLQMPDGERREILEHDNILFICHSLGGIVCRRLVEQNQSLLAKKALGLALIASPTLGSEYAKTFSLISKIYKNKVATALMPDSDSLDDIDNRFRQVLETKSIPLLVGIEAVEHHGPFSIIGLKPVVLGKSASRYFGQERIIPKSDHFSIAKPDSPSHPSHKLLVYFYQKRFQLITLPNLKNKPIRATYENSEDTALFEVYTPKVEHLYLCRSIDALALNTLRVTSAWLVGDSGVGKTSVARRYIHISKITPIQISLSQLGTTATGIDMLQEIAESMQADPEPSYEGSISARATDLVSKRAAVSIVPLFIDELPLTQSEVSSERVRALGNLLDNIKRNSRADVKFLVCSINPPPEGSLNGKMREQFTIITISSWKNTELRELIELIVKSLPELNLTDEQKDLLITSANGSPRFVKTFFRHFQIDQLNKSDATTPENLIATTRSTLRGL